MGPTLSSSRISAVTLDFVEITTVTGVDRSGLFREIGRHTATHPLARIDIYEGYEVGDYVHITIESGTVVVREAGTVYRTPPYPQRK